MSRTIRLWAVGLPLITLLSGCTADFIPPKPPATPAPVVATHPPAVVATGLYTSTAAGHGRPKAEARSPR